MRSIYSWVGGFRHTRVCFDMNLVWQVQHLVRVKHLSDRLRVLQNWHSKGGVMIMGYEMYRVLSLATKTVDEEWRKEIRATLVDPGSIAEDRRPPTRFEADCLQLPPFVFAGPDFVVCDEGHILRNDASRISKALNAVKTRRRVVLTGTPLQNNLVECRSAPLYLLTAQGWTLPRESAPYFSVLFVTLIGIFITIVFSFSQITAW